jgi:sigma-B regulation protein RsbU (phosphoserine phosphatase)
LFSDGVTEAMNLADEMFGSARLRDVVSGMRNVATLEELQKTILGAIENFTRGAKQADDITLLLVRYSSATRVT